MLKTLNEHKTVKSRKSVGVIEFIFSLITTDSNNALYLFSTTAQTLGALFGIVFSLTLVAVQLASQTYSPRLITLFLRDKWTKFFIGFYLFAIFYNVILLNAVPKEFSNFPLLGNFGLIVDFRWLILGSIVLSIISAFVMCWYIIYVLDLLKPENIVKRLIKDIKIEKVDNDLNDVRISMLPFEDAIKRLIEIEDEYTITVAINYLKDFLLNYYSKKRKIDIRDSIFLSHIMNIVYNVGVLCLNKNLYNSVTFSIYFLCEIGKFLLPKIKESYMSAEDNIFRHILIGIIETTSNFIVSIDEEIKNKIPEFKEAYSHFPTS